MEGGTGRVHIMFIANRIYEFIPPEGEPSTKISVLGGQHYSPGQRRKNEIWEFHVPPMFAAAIPDRTEVGSFREAVQLIAACFCDGDEASAEDLLVLVHSEDS